MSGRILKGLFVFSLLLSTSFGKPNALIIVEQSARKSLDKLQEKLAMCFFIRGCPEDVVVDITSKALITCYQLHRVSERTHTLCSWCQGVWKKKRSKEEALNSFLFCAASIYLEREMGINLLDLELRRWVR
ncbi:hypothetical protein [Hydrogenivirga sp. 128-5-R1-1]|uniref:hypothetical protein n=1 Tax=Hydrogenivirga sp. 128-5-R1-1 TaxID=392423 RepID=UPI00015F3361|nr:hypothetical protein [Hydrogenivirga sp. 128-5-R1-1]EDP74865.1 hypothetical protein HG1285_13392 [Hydrogenivirga sp. 128-5-R1-1]